MPVSEAVCPLGLVAEMLELQNNSKQVQTPVTLLLSLSDLYSWKRYEALFSPAVS